ncbi:glyoxylate/hydroxypyruvate reductase A [Roseiarcus fermentans]|uniref:Glyoxylate/hydroxypyruvate reductase A n=1 Tax=Roseiarcus fermentans TaxID=1473586 RepID=A0A366EJS9_9HYPH|nr:glyoxylate/hydroxypyruvate reductase A [Roseiarcus fermentans]RBP02677.1 glyoxylate/hydroxypyruvate reductase A [Roseiarcus fermentans]
MSILFAAPDMDAGAWRARLADQAPDHAVALLGEPFDPSVVRYVLSWRHPDGALKELPNLRVVFSLGAGVDHLIADPGLPDVPVVRVVGPELRDRMSEWVVMHALIHLRQLRRYERQQRERQWSDDETQPKASDVQVGVLGLGVLGADAAKKLRAVGFSVSGWSTTPKLLDGVRSFHGEEGLRTMLSEADILVALLPLTATTRGMLNAALIRRLKQGGPLGGPVLINAGRGGLQVEADIVAALDRGVLRGASLDVFEREPLPALSPLWSHPCVYVSPHNAAISEPGAIVAGVVRQIEAFERGDGLQNVVDRVREY